MRDEEEGRDKKFNGTRDKDEGKLRKKVQIWKVSKKNQFLLFLPCCSIFLSTCQLDQILESHIEL
jgi:hypothetical protein